jgi:16S rRNA (guanine966-N2)-methyltransferase
MVRVIAGEFKRRVLKTLEGQATRPTSDRLKETLFDLLQSKVFGSNFLDCFAGSGSIGIEALSRGAAFAAFIESSRQACQVIEENLSQLRLSSSTAQRLLARPVEAALKILQQEGRKFDIVFLDPPYREAELYRVALKQLVAGELLKPAALVIVEHSRHFPLPEAPDGMEQIRQVRQGDSLLSLYRLKADGGAVFPP